MRALYAAVLLTWPRILEPTLDNVKSLNAREDLCSGSTQPKDCYVGLHLQAAVRVSLVVVHGLGEKDTSAAKAHGKWRDDCRQRPKMSQAQLGWQDYMIYELTGFLHLQSGPPHPPQAD